METVAQLKKRQLLRLRRMAEAQEREVDQMTRELAIVETLGGTIHRDEIPNYLARDVIMCKGAHCYGWKAAGLAEPERCQCGKVFDPKHKRKRPLSRQMVSRLIARGEFRPVPGWCNTLFSLDDVKAYKRSRPALGGVPKKAVAAKKAAIRKRKLSELKEVVK